MIEDYEKIIRKIIIKATKNALRILKRDWRFEVSRTSRQLDHDLLWRVDLLGVENPGWITFPSPPAEGVDETWYTKEIVQLIEGLIKKNNNN
jgi:hypothetical protein